MAKKEKKRFDFEIPDNVSRETKLYVRSVIRELREKFDLDHIDKGALTMLMTSYEMYLQATNELLKDGPLILNKFGDAIAHPAQTIASKNYRQVLDIMKEYGMTVKSRKTLDVKAEVDDDSPIAQYLRMKNEGK